MARPEKRRKAVYAGSFDPLTVGHVWMIEQGAALFDELVVAIGINPGKRPTFSLEERLAMLQESVGHLSRVQIASFGQQFLIDYAREAGAAFILRGIRSQADFEYERTMRNINGDIAGEVTTLFLMPPRDIAEVSSSMVKGLVGPAGWQKIVRPYVPKPVYARLIKRPVA